MEEFKNLIKDYYDKGYDRFKIRLPSNISRHNELRKAKKNGLIADYFFEPSKPDDISYNKDFIDFEFVNIILK